MKSDGDCYFHYIENIEEIHAIRHYWSFGVNRTLLQDRQKNLFLYGATVENFELCTRIRRWGREMRRYLTGVLNFLRIATEAIKVIFLPDHDQDITFFNHIMGLGGKIKCFFCLHLSFHHSSDLFLDANNI